MSIKDGREIDCRETGTTDYKDIESKQTSLNFNTNANLKINDIRIENDPQDEKKIKLSFTFSADKHDGKKVKNHSYNITVSMGFTETDKFVFSYVMTNNNTNYSIENCCNEEISSNVGKVCFCLSDLIRAVYILFHKEIWWTSDDIKRTSGEQFLNEHLYSFLRKIVFNLRDGIYQKNADSELVDILNNNLYLTQDKTMQNAYRRYKIGLENEMKNWHVKNKEYIVLNQHDNNRNMFINDFKEKFDCFKNSKFRDGFRKRSAQNMFDNWSCITNNCILCCNSLYRWCFESLNK